VTLGLGPFALEDIDVEHAAIAESASVSDKTLTAATRGRGVV
jgi:hypothetical protein